MIGAAIESRTILDPPVRPWLGWLTDGIFGEISVEHRRKALELATAPIDVPRRSRTDAARRKQVELVMAFPSRDTEVERGPDRAAFSPKPEDEMLVASVLEEWESQTGFLLGYRSFFVRLRAEADRIDPYAGFRPTNTALILSGCRQAPGGPEIDLEEEWASASRSASRGSGDSLRRGFLPSAVDRRMPAVVGAFYEIRLYMGWTGDRPPAAACEAMFRLAAYRRQRPNASNAWGLSGAREAARAFQRPGVGL